MAKNTFRGPIRVHEMPIWGFWGLVCIEKWPQNFDLSIRFRSANFGTPKMAKTGCSSHFGELENGTSGAGCDKI